MAGKAVAYIVAIIVILALIYVAVSVISYKPTTTTAVTTVSTVSAPAPAGTVALMLTDPAQVPQGTEYLNVTFSGARMHEYNATNTTGFVDVNVTGTINLLSLVNLTQTIGVAHVNPKQKFDYITLNITSATIDINGTTYNVTVPSSTLHIGISNFNGTSGAALIDLSPTVVEIYTSNSTIFVLVPSVRAVALGNSTVNSTSVHVGARARINPAASNRLRFISPKIEITSASLNVSGNRTSLSVTVKNDGNASATLNQLLLFGLMRISMPYNASLHSHIHVMPQSRISMQGFGSQAIVGALGHIASSYNISNTLSQLNASYNGSNFNISSFISKLSSHGFNVSSMANISQFNSRFGTKLNASAFNSLRANIGSMINVSVIKALHTFNFTNGTYRNYVAGAGYFNGHYHNMLNFLITSSGSLELPFNEVPVVPVSTPGYALGAGNTITLSYSSNISLGRSGMLIIPLENQTYSLRVVGRSGAFAEANVTAG